MTDRSILPWDDDPDGEREAAYERDMRRMGIGALAMILLLCLGLAGAWWSGRLG